MKDLPGVDPDGKAPGGLEIAGNVEAGSMSIAGVPLVSAGPIDVFIAASNAGTTIVSSATLSGTTQLPLDTVQLSNPSFPLSVDKKTVTINRPGTYLAFVSPFLDSGSIGSGQMIGYLLASGTGAILGVDGSGAAANAGTMTGLSMALLVVTTPTDCHVVVTQSSGGDLPMDAEVVIARLGD